MTLKKYTKDHEWIEINEDTGTVGITNYAQESLGDIVFIDLPDVAKKVLAGNDICVIESVKAASDIYSPLDGEIIEINKKVSDDSALINRDPEGEGWIFKIKITNHTQVNDLLDLEAYQQLIKTD